MRHRPCIRPVGASLAIIVRLADWVGPIKIPRPSPATQNHGSLGAKTPPATPSSSPLIEITRVRLAPIQSSIQAKAKAPSPALTLSPIPNRMTSAISMPKVPAA